MDKLNNIKHIRDWMPETDEMFSKRGLAPEMPIKSIPRLDGFLWGLHRQEMSIIAARPSNGKSILSIQLAWDMAKQGKSVYFMSLEMAVPRIIERIFTNECLVDNGVIWRGALKTDKVVAQKYEEFKSKLGRTKLVLSDMIGRTAQDLKTIEDAFSRHPDVIVIDHLNEISGGDNKSLAIEQYLGRLREMAIRRNVALVLCCQVNRTSRSDEDKKPQLHQLKSSGAIEEKADSVIMLHYPYFYDKTEDMNELQVIVAKNRYGATGHAKLYVHPQYSRISDDGSVHRERVELDVAGSNREPSKESPVHSTSVQLPMDKGQAPAVSAWSGTKEEWEA
jgi:replicative DNA helicase